MTDFARGPVLTRYFSGLCDYIFATRLGVADPPLVDYLSDLLIRFVRNDALHRVRGPSGTPAVEVVEMLSEAENRVGLAKRDVHQQIGDVTLFWTGLYPEALAKLRGVDRKDLLVDYSKQGKRAYHIAATIATDRSADAPNELLERLSARFDLCAFGLGEVRREWEQGDENQGLLLS